MRRTVSIRLKLVRNLVMMVLVLGGSIMVVFWFGSRRAVRTLSESIIRATLQTTEQELQSFFEPVVLELQVARTWAENSAFSLDPAPDETSAMVTEKRVRTELMNRFIPLIEQLPRLSSLLVADVTGREFMLLRGDAGMEVWQIRVGPDGALVRHRTWSDYGADLSATRPDYDPRTRPWFTGALTTKNESKTANEIAGVYWTEPYTFFTTREPGITASVEVRSPTGVEQVIGFDILLSDISSFTQSLRVSQRGKLVVLTSDNLVVGLPDDPRFEERGARLAAYLKGPEDIGLEIARDATRAFANARIDGDGPDSIEADSSVRFESLGELWWGDTRRFYLTPERHLKMAVLVPERELLGDVVYQRVIIAIILTAVLVIGVWRAVVLARTLSSPVEELVSQADRIGRGDLEKPPPIQTEVSEVRQLAIAHDRMREGLRSLIKLERDIQIARQIQQSTFPRTLPRLEGFDIAAWNAPADETGGDTYDVIGYTFDAIETRRGTDGRAGASTVRLTGETANRAILLLADATGHGIGPALAATQIRAMLRMAVRLGADLRDIAQHLNDQLVADLPGNRFITAWLGEVDASEGVVTTFSAGQGPILHYVAASGEFVGLPANAPPFGVVPDLQINVPDSLSMAVGDLLVVLSDGLFEPRNRAGEQFGLARTYETIAAASGGTARDVIAAVRAAVEAFTENAAADDDRTIIVIRRTT